MLKQPGYQLGKRLPSYVPRNHMIVAINYHSVGNGLDVEKVTASHFHFFSSETCRYGRLSF